MKKQTHCTSEAPYCLEGKKLHWAYTKAHARAGEKEWKGGLEKAKAEIKRKDNARKAYIAHVEGCASPSKQVASIETYEQAARKDVICRAFIALAQCELIEETL